MSKRRTSRSTSAPTKRADLWGRTDKSHQGGIAAHHRTHTEIDWDAAIARFKAMLHQIDRKP